jgi:hypothetical protein
MQDLQSLTALSEVYHDRKMSLEGWPTWVARYNERPTALVSAKWGIAGVVDANMPMQLELSSEDVLAISVRGIKHSEIFRPSTLSLPSTKSASTNMLAQLEDICSIILEFGIGSFDRRLVQSLVRSFACGTLYPSYAGKNKEWRQSHLQFARVQAELLKSVLSDQNGAMLPPPSARLLDALIEILATALALGFGMSIASDDTITTLIPKLMRFAMLHAQETSEARVRSGSSGKTCLRPSVL